MGTGTPGVGAAAGTTRAGAGAGEGAAGAGAGWRVQDQAIEPKASSARYVVRRFIEELGWEESQPTVRLGIDGETRRESEGRLRAGYDAAVRKPSLSHL